MWLVEMSTLWFVHLLISTMHLYAKMDSLEEPTPHQLLPQEVHVKLAHLYVEAVSTLALEIVTLMAASRVVSRPLAPLIAPSASKDVLHAQLAILILALNVDIEGSLIGAFALAAPLDVKLVHQLLPVNTASRASLWSQLPPFAKFSLPTASIWVAQEFAIHVLVDTSLTLLQKPALLI